MAGRVSNSSSNLLCRLRSPAASAVEKSVKSRHHSCRRQRRSRAVRQCNHAGGEHGCAREHLLHNHEHWRDGASGIIGCATIGRHGRLRGSYYWSRGRSLHFNRLITAAESQTITAEAQSTDVLPWYFAVVNGFEFLDISGSGTPLDLEDDGSDNITMPFRFNLFGVESDQLCINNNGFMLLDWSKPCDGFYEDASIPNESVPLISTRSLHSGMTSLPAAMCITLWSVRSLIAVSSDSGIRRTTTITGRAIQGRSRSK